MIEGHKETSQTKIREKDAEGDEKSQCNQPPIGRKGAKGTTTTPPIFMSTSTSTTKRSSVDRREDVTTTTTNKLRADSQQT